jgi:hypothetical protein
MQAETSKRWPKVNCIVNIPVSLIPNAAAARAKSDGRITFANRRKRNCQRSQDPVTG